MSSAYQKPQYVFRSPQQPQHIGNRHSYYTSQQVGRAIFMIAVTLLTIGALTIGIIVLVENNKLETEVAALDASVNMMLNMTKDDVLELLGNATDFDSRLDALDTHVADSSIHFTEASIDHTNIVAGDGSDHDFIDQDVTTTGTPTFASVTTSFLNTGTAQALSGPGAVTITELVTALTTTGANALTLADGAVGQVKIISMVASAGAGTLTPTNLAGGSTITFNNVGDSATLLFIGTSWAVIGVSGAVVA